MENDRLRSGRGLHGKENDGRRGLKTPQKGPWRIYCLALNLWRL